MRALFAIFFLAAAGAVSFSQPLVAPFEFVIPSWDSSRSEWLPEFAVEVAGSHGFVRASDGGRLEFEDGTPVRFVGVGVTNTACFPDSAAAVATARRLRKLGVNIVRFNYFDYHNSNAQSTLAPASGPNARFDSLSPTQMARLDWFVHQLRINGIYTHFVLKSRQGPRPGDGVPTFDSASTNGQNITYFSAPFQRLQREYLSAFLSHVNPHTGRRYADEPAVALVTVTDQNSLYDAWINDRLRPRAGILSYHQSRLIDTLYADYLSGRYGTTAAIRAAYFEGVSPDGPDRVRNGGFESFADNWGFTVGEGAQASTVLTEGPNVAPGEGQFSIRVAVRQVNGNDARIYLEQTALPVRRNAIYRVSFKARTDTAAGRQMRVAVQRGGTAVGLNQTVDLTTTWQPFSFVFRATDGDSLSTSLRFYMGRSRGDIFLDAVSVRETGREGLAEGEALETSTVARMRFNETQNHAVRRVHDLAAFYDSLARAYHRSMHAHIRSLGVRVPIAGTNNTSSAADTWTQSEYDFTSETAQWDFNGARPGSPGYSDSTWVIRNYSVLNYRDQKIFEFSRNAIAGKPFVAEAYNHVFPNAHRSEMMIFFPAYASLHDWDGAYFQLYVDRTTEMANRRRIIKDDFTTIIGDPSVTALLPQAAALLRHRWLAPAERTILIRHDEADLRALPLLYPGRGSYQIDGTFGNVANLVGAVRIDSFTAHRHYTAGDYYYTVPNDDNIQSDTRQITLDMTKGVISLNAPMVQGGSGVLANVSALRSDRIGVNFIDGGRHVTYLWTPLDGDSLAVSRRSLLTVTTRAGNADQIWQFGDSSLGKNWGTGPVVMESAKVGVNFYTDADTVILHPLDTIGREIGRTFGAVRTPAGAWRAIIDLGSERTPWFGVEQRFSDNPSAADGGAGGRRVYVGEARPSPAAGEARIDVEIPAPVFYSCTLHDALGRTVLPVEEGRATAGRSVQPLDLRGLSAGVYLCRIRVGDEIFTRRVAVR